MADIMGVESSQGHMQRRWLDTISRIWAWLFLLGMVLFFSIFGQGFFTPFNLQSILANMAILTIIALGQTYLILSGAIDLSFGWVMAMSPVLAAPVLHALP